MTQYLKTVITAVVSVSVLTTLLPKDGFSKYVNILASILVMTVVIAPVFKLSPELRQLDTEELKIVKTDYVSAEFEKNLEEKIKTEMKSKTNIEFTVEVDATTEEIKSIKIFPYSQEYAKALAQFTGVGEDKVIKNEN